MSDAENAGKQAAAVVEHVVTDANAQTQAELDDAKRRADEAQAASRQIADAAMSSELGQRIQSTREEFATWKTAQETELQTLKAQSQEATGLLGSIRQLLTQPTVVTNPPPLVAAPVTVPTDASSTKTEQSEKPKVPAETLPPPERKPRHFL